MPRPSLAQVAAIAFFALVAFPRSAIPLVDGDVWWHIRAGAEVLATGRVPDVDTWSIVGDGRPWTSQDWLSNVILALVQGPDPSPGIGSTAASLLYAGLVVAALVFLWLALTTRGVRGWVGRIVWLAAGLTVAGPTIGVRVQVIDLTLAAATLLMLWGHMADGRLRWLMALPVIAVLWANLHAGWPLIFLLGGAVVVGELFDRRWRTGSRAGIGALVVALVVAAMVIVVNPNGLELYGYPLETLGISAFRDFLAEWAPPNLGSIVGRMFAAFVALGVLPALLLRTGRLRASDMLILGGLTVMAASSARFLLLVPIAATVVCMAFDGSLHRVAGRARLGATLGRMAAPAPTSRLALTNLVLIALIVVAGVGVAWARVGPAAQREAVATHMPTAAVAWLRSHPSGERPFNTYSWGGYLGLHRPELPVFIDGRSDIYGAGPIRAYAAAVQLEEDPQALLDRHDIDHVLFNTGTRLAAWLDASDAWTSVYADEVASIWTRRQP